MDEMAGADVDAQRGIYMHSTDVKTEIAKMKKQRKELDNLEPYHKVEIRKLKNRIKEIIKEIDRIYGLD